jgi:hypothetical protein
MREECFCERTSLSSEQTGMVAERRRASPASAKCLGRRTSNKSERKRPRLPGILSAEDLTEVSRVTRRFRKGIAVVACRKERTDAVKTSPQRRKPFPPVTLYTRGEPVNAVVARYPDCVPEPKRGSFRHCKLLHYSTAEKSKQMERPTRWDNVAEQELNSSILCTQVVSLDGDRSE